MEYPRIREAIWYEFRKKIVGEDHIHYKFYESKPNNDELYADYRAWASVYRGAEPAVAYVQFNSIDAPPKDVVEQLLVEAQLVFANAEHQVMTMRRELEYQDFLDENKLR